MTSKPPPEPPFDDGDPADASEREVRPPAAPEHTGVFPATLGRHSAGTGAIAPVESPSDDRTVLHAGPDLVVVDVDTAVAGVQRAQASWERVPILERCRAVQRLRHRVYARRNDFIATLNQEASIPEFEVLGIEMLSALEHLRYYVAAGPHLLAPVRRDAGFRARGKTYEIHRVPWGAIGLIAPRQYPIAVPMAQLAAALVAGNGVVLKLSDLLERTSGQLRDVIDEFVRDDPAVPDGLIQVLPQGKRYGIALAAAGCDKMIFNGALSAARDVARASATKLTPTAVFCGGVNPMLVLEDANLSRAALAACWSVFTACGQTSALIDRAYVAEASADAFADETAAIARNLRVGKMAGGYEVGHLPNREALEHSEALIADAVAKGARVVCGGRRIEGVRGNYLHPTVLADCTPEMAILQSDIQSPILPVRSMTDLDDAIDELERSAALLCASIFTEDAQRAHDLAMRLPVGTVAVNDAVVPFVDPALPWTARGESGHGDTHGPEGLLAMTRVKAIAVDDGTQRFKPWWFPYNADKVEALRQALVLRHDPNPLNRLAAWIRLWLDPEYRKLRRGHEQPYVPGMKRSKGGRSNPFQAPLARLFR